MSLRTCANSYTAAYCADTLAYLLQTNGTGCCDIGREQYVVGSCNECTGDFECPPYSPPVAFSFSTLSWGSYLALAADTVISFGLALQKYAHKRMYARTGENASSLSESCQEPAWVLGTLLLICAESGNFMAYGDAKTPAAVVASLGCVSVIANWVISCVWLEERFRLLDLFGVGVVILGVVLIIFFVPAAQQEEAAFIPCPLWFSRNFSDAPCGTVPQLWPSGGAEGSPLRPGAEVCDEEFLVYKSGYWYIWQPAWLIYLAVTLAGIGVSQWLLRRDGPQHAASFLIVADIAGGYTVCASVTVSTFLFSYAIGAGKWYVLAEPLFWAMGLVMGITAVVQMDYINKAMAHFDASIVVPTHYVLFTIFSILGPSILYQQLAQEHKSFPLPGAWMWTLFITGIVLTSLGVAILSCGKGAQSDEQLDPQAESEPVGSPQRSRSRTVVIRYGTMSNNTALFLAPVLAHSRSRTTSDLLAEGNGKPQLRARAPSFVRGGKSLCYSLR